MPEWTIYPVAIYVLIAVILVFMGIVSLVSGTNDAERVAGARAVVAGLFWPVALVIAVVYGAYWVIKTAITGRV